MGDKDGAARPAGKLRRRLDRAAVGALMSVLVFLVERRLNKVVRRSRRPAHATPTVRVR